MGEEVSYREIHLPVRTVSESNVRGHWAKRARRAKEQRKAARILVRASLAGGRWDGQVIIRLTRHGPRELDSDNLAGALKAVRDGVADALEIDDGSKRLRWEYAQARGEYGVLVEIEATDGT